MKKTLKICLIDNYYLIKCGDKELKILKDELSVTGQDLFDNIFYDVNLDETLEIDYEEENITDSADKRIVGDFKKVIETIVLKINQKISVN